MSSEWGLAPGDGMRSPQNSVGGPDKYPPDLVKKHDPAERPLGLTD